VTHEILLVLVILGGAVVAFVGGWLRLDIVALLVMISLTLTGLISPGQALAGFSNPAVITVAGMFVISAALGRTGVASLIGRRIMRVAGRGERRLVATIMAAAGGLSAFMNNAGVAAMMLPVVMDIARRTRRAPSRLLMPLALGVMLGGTMTIIGTPPNLLASDVLRDAGVRPLGVFEFTPIGALILGAGVLLMVGWGLRVLPEADPRSDPHSALAESFGLQERLFMIRLPLGSLLDGRTLGASRLGSALGLNVVAVFRGRRAEVAPATDYILHAGDRLLVQGRPDLLRELRDRRRHLALEDEQETIERLVSADIGFAEAIVHTESSLVGRDLAEVNFRDRYHCLVVAILRDGVPRRTDVGEVPLLPGDVLLLQGRSDGLDALERSPELGAFRRIGPDDVRRRYQLEERFLTLRVTDRSILVGRSLAETRIGDAAGLTVLGIVRDGRTLLMPAPDTLFQANDLLLVKAKPEDLLVMRGLQRIEIERDEVPDLNTLESDSVGLLEVVLSPRTNLVGRTPRQAHFRERYGVSILAVWREGRSYRSNLRDMPLRFGDALLLFGPRDRLRVVGADANFVSLTEAVREPPRFHRAPLASFILVGTLAPVILGLLPISIAVILGSITMVLTGCLKAEEAYDAIDLPALVLIAGMLSLGTALAATGAAAALAQIVVGTTAGLGPRGVLLGLALITALGAQVIPAPALVVLMAPIALDAAAGLGLSPRALVMGIALSSTSVASPVAHAANALVMGPGGYRYADYARVGLPITAIILLLVVLVLPFLVPLT
jgi:di/tricarboxylate transporter